MFTQLLLTNFKSFTNESKPIPLAPVTILVGANGSGKSNLLDAFRFLQGIGRNLTISEILTGKFEGGMRVFEGMRGGFKEVCWYGTSEFSIQTNQNGTVEHTHWVPHAEMHTVVHRIACNVSAAPHISSESLDVDDVNHFDAHDGSISALSEVNSNGGLTKLSHGNSSGSLENARSLLNQFDSFAMRFESVSDYGSLVANRYRKARFLDISPKAMRSFVAPNIPELGERGENLSAVVRQICDDASRKQQFLDWLTELCAPHVYDIDFARNDLLEVLVQLVEGNGEKRKISARSISDGTLRFMGLLAAMYSAPEGSLFLLEEIENGLHPTRVHLLVELFEQFAAARNLQIIATTHSSQALLALSKPALESAILFARNEESPGTITRRLGDLDDFEDVTQRSKIDYLFTTGWLERAL